ncbi:hypothetical protein P7C73_g5138, partial [Tremellales sp. Uapishka_1]
MQGRGYLEGLGSHAQDYRTTSTTRPLRLLAQPIASTSKLPPKPKPITGIRLHKQVASPTTSTKEKRAEPVEEPVSDDLNLTHASQSLSHPDPDLETWQSLYPGLSEDQVFKLVTRPEDSDWEIPDAVDAELADERLKVGVKTESLLMTRPK